MSSTQLGDMPSTVILGESNVDGIAGSICCVVLQGEYVVLCCREHMLWEDKMRTKEGSLKMREDSVRREKMEYDQTLHNEVTK